MFFWAFWVQVVWHQQVEGIFNDLIVFCREVVTGCGANRNEPMHGEGTPGPSKSGGFRSLTGGEPGHRTCHRVQHLCRRVRSSAHALGMSDFTVSTVDTQPAHTHQMLL